MNWQETKLQLEKYGIENLSDEWQWCINLSGVYLSNADLTGADLTNADLSGTNLSGVYLSNADLTGADLTGADLRGADLRGVDLRGANLSGVYLSNADLRGANLSGVDLSGVDLSGTNLSGADLTGADLPTYQKWYVTWKTDGTVKIGCKEKTIAEWDAWFASDETFETKRNTADFERIQAAYEHAKQMYEIYQKYEANDAPNKQ